MWGTSPWPYAYDYTEMADADALYTLGYNAAP